MENINEKPREYSNQELLDMVNETLLNSEYKDFKLAYVLKVKDESENCYAVAINGDEIIGFNPLEKEIDRMPEWDFCADNELFQELEWNREIIYMSLENHYGVWNEISNCYPDDIEHKEGMQEYLKYCKKQKIDISKIQEDVKGTDVKDVMQYLEKSKKRDENKIAVIDEHGKCTYKELMENSKKIGSEIAKKIETKRPVPVLMEKGINALNCICKLFLCFVKS